jgi:hypothetical protein
MLMTCSASSKIFCPIPEITLGRAIAHSRIKNGNGACKFSFSAEMAQKVNLRPMEFAYRSPVVGIVDANLAILSSNLHSGEE